MSEYRVRLGFLGQEQTFSEACGCPPACSSCKFDGCPLLVPSRLCLASLVMGLCEAQLSRRAGSTSRNCCVGHARGQTSASSMVQTSSSGNAITAAMYLHGEAILVYLRENECSS